MHVCLCLHRKLHTIYHHSDSAKLVIHYISSASYLRIIDGHTALITCTGVTWLYIIDYERKVVI